MFNCNLLDDEILMLNELNFCRILRRVNVRPHQMKQIDK